MSTIYVDYDSARRQVKKLLLAAENCDEIIRNVNTQLKQLPNYWEGASADTFREILQQEIREIQNMKETITSVAHHIQKVACELEDKEKELVAAIQSNPSSASITGSQLTGQNSSGIRGE